MELDVAVRTSGNVTVVDVTGEVDLYTAPRLEEALAKASGRTPPLIVVNLGKTTYLDSTALRVLTAVFKRVRERQGEMAIAEVQPKIAKLFTLTGLDQVLPLCPTEREALDKVHQPRAST
jgi:anti-sigma B factor antagonist